MLVKMAVSLCPIALASVTSQGFNTAPRRVRREGAQILAHLDMVRREDLCKTGTSQLETFSLKYNMPTQVKTAEIIEENEVMH